MKRVILNTVLFFAFTAFCGDLDVARQALADGVWRSALAAADSAATNAADRTQARLISLEALAHLGEDAEIRRRLSEWNESASEHFRFWRARSFIRVGDFEQAKAALKEPFADSSLALPVATLKSAILISSEEFRESLKVFSGLDVDNARGFVGEDAKLAVAEALDRTGEKDRSRSLLAALAGSAERREVKVRAGYLLGFSEMEDASTYTSGVKRIRALLRSNPEDVASEKAAKAFAVRLLKAGDAIGAEDELRRYLEAYPSAAMDAKVLEPRGEALFRLGRYSEAAGVFVRAEQAAPSADDKARLAYLHAQAYLAEDKFTDAAASFARSASYGSDGSRRSLYAQADALERGGDAQGAIAIYSELAGGSDVWADKSRLRLIMMTARAGRLGEAIDRYSKLISSPGELSHDDLTEAYLGRGRACYRDYRFKEASADFAVVASRKPELADGMRFLMALCLYGAGRDAEARKAATVLAKSAKDSALRADMMLWCAKYDFNHGEYQSAQSNFMAYASARKATPSASEALLWAARCASAQMEHTQAVELATQVANSVTSGKPLFIEALFVQGEALMELGRYAEAAQLFDRVSNLAGEDPVSRKADLLRADALYAMGAGDATRYDEAIVAYGALLDAGGLSPDFRIEASFKIGRALEKLKRTKQAMDQYYRNVVIAYSEESAKGMLFGAPARTFFSRAAFSLADYHAAAGDTATVRKMLRRIVDADVPAAREAKRRLDELDAKGDE